MKKPHSSLFTLFFALATITVPAGAVHAQSSAAELPNPGPRSSEEAKILWDDVQLLLPQFDRMSAEESKNPNGSKRRALSRATGKLARLVDRYPRDARVPEALELLIRLHLREQNFTGAVTRAKQFLLTDSQSERAQRVRGLLVDAYLESNKFTQARATAKELLTQSKDDLTRGRALLSLSRVDTRQRKYREARARLDALPEGFPPYERDGLLLEIGLHECTTTSPVPGKNARGDDPWIEYFEKRNLCLKTLAASQHDKPANSGHPLWCGEFIGFRRELDSRSINSFQKTRLQAELAKTSDMAKPMKCEKIP